MVQSRPRGPVEAKEVWENQFVLVLRPVRLGTHQDDIRKYLPAGARKPLFITVCSI